MTCYLTANEQRAKRARKHQQCALLTLSLGMVGVALLLILRPHCCNEASQMRRQFQAIYKNEDEKMVHTQFRKCSNFLIVRFPKITFVQDVPIYLLIFFEAFWYKKSHKTRVNRSIFDH